jgi:UDP-N-acetylmuramoyl-tripeptide--D-alanyl-D-alanine ligase
MSPRLFSAEEIYALFRKHPVLTTDSRRVPVGSMFFALKGDHFDGNLFAGDALDGGAAIAVIDNPAACFDHRCYLVKDTLSTLQEIASIHRDSLNIPVIGITGSNGKTTTKELIFSVISRTSNTIATQGNLNNHIGVPLTLLRAGAETEVLIVEMGANHRGEIAALCRIARPTHAIITNIGKAHLEGFGSPEGVKEAKKELFDYLESVGRGTIIWNSDDPVLVELVARYSISKMSYGEADTANVWGISAAKPDDLFLNIRWCVADESRLIKTRLVGGYNFHNVMAALAIGVLFKVPDADIASAIEAYQPSNSRSEFRDTGKNRIVIDCYNANPSSMMVALENFHRISKGEQLLILGDMFELGEYADEEHWKIIEHITASGIESILIGEVFRRIGEGTSMKVFADVGEAIAHIKSAPVSDREILLKGSRGVQLEKLLEYL